MELTLEQQKAIAAANAARARAEAQQPRLTPVDHGPFREAPGVTLTPVDHDPFSPEEVEIAAAQAAAARARARAAKAKAEAQGGGMPWERDWSQPQAPAESPGLKPWDRYRTQGNIQKMIDRGAPEAEIDAYVAAEGVTPEQLRNAPDPEIAAYTGEVLSGDPSRARKAIVRDEFDRMPEWQRALVATDDVIRQSADAMTFGLADKFGGKLSELTGLGPTTDERCQNTEDARSRSGPGVSIANQMIGAAVPAGAMMRAGATAFRALPASAGLGGRLVAAGVDGAGLGALNAFGHDQNIGEGAAFGVLGGVAGQGVSEGVSKVAQGLGQAIKRATGNVPKVPSTDELEAAGHAAFKAADNAGVMLSRDGLQRLHQNVVDDLTDFGFHPTVQPNAAALQEIERIAGGNATLKGLHTARKIASKGFTSGARENREDNAALAKIIERIDEHIGNLANKSTDVVMGDAENGSKALKDGIDIWSRMAKSREVERIVRDADFSQDAERAIRTQLGRLAKKGGMTPDEFMAALDVSQGSLPRNMVTYAGRAFASNAGALGAASSITAVGGGLASGQPMAATLPAVGYGAKVLSDRVTKNKAQQLAAMIRAGGSQAAMRGPDNALQRLAKSKRDVLARCSSPGSWRGSRRHQASNRPTRANPTTPPTVSSCRRSLSLNKANPRAVPKTAPHCIPLSLC